MPGRVDHHVALRVSDMDAAITFWQQALDARVVAAPVIRGGTYFERVVAGVQVKVAHLALEAGAIELFEFVELTPSHAWERPDRRRCSTRDGRVRRYR